MKEQTKISHLRSVWETITFTGRHLCIFPILLCAISSSQIISVAWLFVAIGIFDHIKKCVLRFMLAGFRNAIQTSVSIDRVEVLEERRLLCLCDTV